jgi:nicotinamidase-related amidase
MEALIVVDMQKDFLEPEGKLYGGERVRSVIPKVREAINFSRDFMPIICTQDWHRKDDEEFSLWPPHCIEGSPGAEIVEEIGVKEEDIFVKKRRYSAFFSTDLDLILREKNIRKLWICGVLTNICVLHTIADARSLNYEVGLLKDCTEALNDYDYKYAVHHITNVLGAEVITLETFFSLREEDVG